MKTPKLNHLLDVEKIESKDGFVTLPIEAIEQIESLLPSIDKEQENEQESKKEATESGLSEKAKEFLKENDITDSGLTFEIPFEIVEKQINKKSEAFQKDFPTGFSISLGKVTMAIQELNKFVGHLG